MRFTTKVVVLFSGVLTLAAISTALVVLGGQQFRHSLDRVDLVHRSYEAHLALSNHTYQLFKQFGDAMMIGDLDRGAMEAELLKSIRSDISRIRETLIEEIRYFGDDRQEDLEHLAKIETKINRLLSEYQVVIDAGIPQSAEDWARLSRILDERVDQDFARLIQTGLERQYGALLYQRTLNQERLRFDRFLSVAVAVLGAIAASIALWWLLRSFNKPINQLIDGAEAFAGGDRRHRIALDGGGELDGVAQAFNRMADEISARQEALESANERLESIVASRTAELERLLATLREAEESRKRLLTDVSHELRTPLTIIRGEADIALRGNGKPVGGISRCARALPGGGDPHLATGRRPAVHRPTPVAGNPAEPDDRGSRDLHPESARRLSRNLGRQAGRGSVQQRARRGRDRSRSRPAATGADDPAGQRASLWGSATSS